MKELHFSDNLMKLRQEKKLTQKQLASFIGVTKGAVSKWENKQSLPDILMLPKLAAYFNVSIDELLGYEPQLNQEQIKRIYLNLAEAFARQPFEEIMLQSQELVKKYYSCYPFLFQICCLWLNHFMLAEQPSRQQEILISITDLCNHILSGCDDIGVRNNTTIVKAIADLQLNKAAEVIDTLEELLHPLYLSQQSDTVLIQAYQLAGQTDQANSFTQLSMFYHLLALVGGATHYLIIHSNSLPLCETTINRIECLLSAYDLERLHPNTAALFYYQAGIVYCTHGKKKKALARLEHYIACIKTMIENPFLHGDSYFNAIEPWFEQLDIGSHAPRDMRIIIENAVQSLSHPSLAILKDNAAYCNMIKTLVKKGETL